jgi:hypothetical protein
MTAFPGSFAHFPVGAGDTVRVGVGAVPVAVLLYLVHGFERGAEAPPLQQDAASGPFRGCHEVDPGGDRAVQEEPRILGLRVNSGQRPFADNLVVRVHDPVVSSRRAEDLGQSLQHVVAGAADSFIRVVRHR